MRKFLFLLFLSSTVFAQRYVGPPISSGSQICKQTTEIAHTGDVALTVLYTCTIPAGTLGLNSRLVVHALAYSKAGNTSNCNYYMGWGTSNTWPAGTLVIQSGAAGSNYNEDMNGTIVMQNATNKQYISGYDLRNINTVIGNNVVGASQNITLPTYFLLAVQNGVTGDTCSIEEADVVLW